MIEARSLVTQLNVMPLADAGARQIRFAEQFGEAPEVQQANEAAQSFRANLEPRTAGERLQSGLTIDAVTDPEDISLRGAAGANAMPHPILANWSRLFLAGLSGELYSRIWQMARYKDGWRGEGSRALTEEALKAFLEFLIKIDEDTVEPTLALTARGTLQAEWFRNLRRHLDVEFVSDEKAFFGLFDQHSVYEGVDSVDALVRWLPDRPSKPLKWRSQ